MAMEKMRVARMAADERMRKAMVFIQATFVATNQDINAINERNKMETAAAED